MLFNLLDVVQKGITKTILYPKRKKKQKNWKDFFFGIFIRIVVFRVP
jgi:hypothetical protein